MHHSAFINIIVVVHVVVIHHRCRCRWLLQDGAAGQALLRQLKHLLHSAHRLWHRLLASTEELLASTRQVFCTKKAIPKKV